MDFSKIINNYKLSELSNNKKFNFTIGKFKCDDAKNRHLWIENRIKIKVKNSRRRMITIQLIDELLTEEIR